MNRDEKRKTVRRLKARGFTDSQIETFFILQSMNIKQKIDDGQRVKLDINSITENVDFNRKTQKYKDWVLFHKNDIFTVGFDKRHKLYFLNEDQTVPKWLFVDSELIVLRVKEEGGL